MRWPSRKSQTRWSSEASIPNGPGLDVVDLPDGSFQLAPDPTRMRDLGLVFTAFGLVPIGVGLVIVVLSLFSLFGHKLPTLTALVAIPLIATGALELLLWNRLFPVP